MPAIKAELREEYQQIHSQVLQNVLLRLKRACDAFFRRVEKGEAPGYPRFQGRNRYNSFTYPQGGYSLTEANPKRGQTECLAEMVSKNSLISKSLKFRVPVASGQKPTLRMHLENPACSLI